VDLKTLEYMELRVNKARMLVSLIAKLKQNIEDVKRISTVIFNNDSHRRQFDSSTGDLSYELKSAYIDLAQKKIQELEKELAEL
jgi:hypothetical protein